MHHTRLGQVWVRRVVCGFVLVCLPALAQALGLGRLVVHSGLDEPLNAEIELLAPTAQELKSLTAAMAPRADFDTAGIDRPPHLLTIKYAVSKRSDGQQVLRLTTAQAMREPFLHFLLQVEWTGGRLVREFTALLDPPHWAAGKPQAIEAPRPLAAPPDQKRTPTTPPVTEAKPPTPPPSAPQPSVPDAAGLAPAPFYGEPLLGPPPLDSADTGGAPELLSDDTRLTRTAGREWAANDDYGPVMKGDTLIPIAQQMRVDESLSIEQIMLALLKTNPEAFIGNNINNLKTGRILKMPERSAIDSISKAQAFKEVRVQYDAWQEYKLKLAGAERIVKAPVQDETKVPAAPEKPADKKPAAVAEKTDAKAAKPVKDKPSSDALLGKDTGDDLLKIVRANLGDEKKLDEKKTDVAEGKRDASTERRVLSDKVTTLEEAVQSRELENKELRERVGILQKQVENTARLIELENKELAVQQKQASEAAPPAAPGPAPAEPPPPAAATAEPPKTTAEKPIAVPPARKLPPAPPPVEDKGLMGLVDELTSNPTTLAVGLGVLVIAAGVLVVYIRRRSRAKAEFAESILSGGALDSGGPDTAAPAASDTSFLSDFSHGGMGTIHHTDEVDPVAEAEVYLAYGRDEQAEEILKEAVTKEPARHELKQKLLEIYHHRNDLRSFETLAEELYAALGGKGGKVWEKVEEMGRKMNPNNPMFRGGAPTARPASEPPTAATPAAAKKIPAAAAAISAAFDETMSSVRKAAPPSPAPKVADTGLSLDLGTGAHDLAAPSDLSFDIDVSASGAAGAGHLSLDEGGDFKPPGAHDTALAVEEHRADDDFISFDAEVKSAAPAPAASAEIEWPAEQSKAAAPAEKDWDETATKLDLAKAYIDMGDNEGARSILDEVIAEGSDQQKQQARDLVAQMA